MVSCPRLRPPRSLCRRAVLSCSSDDAASIRKSGLEIKNRCTKEGVNGEILASIPKLGPEIKNRCTLDGGNEEKFASIRKFGSEIKNRCTKEGENGEKLTSIRKSGPEIKNRCRKQPIFSTHPQHIPSTRSSRVEDVSCFGCLHGAGTTQVRQWRQKRVLMRPEAAFPYVFAAEGAQHPPKKPPRSAPPPPQPTPQLTFRHTSPAHIPAHPGPHPVVVQSFSALGV